MSLRLKYILLLTLVFSLPLVVAGAMSFSITRQAMVQSTLERLNTIADFREGEIYLYLSHLSAQATDFASDGFIRKSLGDKHATVEALNKHLLRNKQPLDLIFRGLTLHFF